VTARSRACYTARMKVLVTGANGFVGSHVARRLAAEGHEVCAMVRATSDRSLLADVEYEVRIADVMEPESLGAAVEGVDAVIHSAAALGAPSQEAFDRVNIGGTSNLVHAVLERAPELSRFLLVSSVAAGGPSTPERRRTEADDPAPISQYGRSKLGQERALAPLHGRVATTIVRPPIVYGPGGSAARPLIVLPARGLMISIGGPARPVSFVHVVDLAAGIVQALLRPEGADETFHITGPEDGTLLDFQRAAAAAAGQVAVPLPVPPRLLSFAGWAADRIKPKIGLQHSFGVDKTVEGLAPSWAVDGRKAGERLGFTPRFGLGTGIRDTLADFRQRGWV
jgi:dihydroflavonol-4-reductase